MKLKNKPLSFWNAAKNGISFDLFFKRISRIGFGLFGFATNTLNT